MNIDPMLEEKAITYSEILTFLKEDNIRYLSLGYGRIPVQMDGTRVLYIVSNGVDIDNVNKLRQKLWDDYHISVEVVRPDNTTWINRSFNWLLV